MISRLITSIIFIIIFICISVLLYLNIKGADELRKRNLQLEAVLKENGLKKN